MLKLEENNNLIVYCRGDENDSTSYHPLIYMYREKNKISCPYCNKTMNKKFTTTRILKSVNEQKDYKHNLFLSKN
ncbi:MAG: zinc-finger domain-containing protein [Wolbachia endosymbiont of Menacanthus eurysternus]|nr:MAG: zinc-finger domain-containing protein [Wolbachia endosymbiont of Menacanthus eurysternus]